MRLLLLSIFPLLAYFMGLIGEPSLALANGYEKALKNERALYELPIAERLHPELRADGLIYKGFTYKPHLKI